MWCEELPEPRRGCMTYGVIRPLEQRDNLLLFRLIVKSLREYSLSGAGTEEEDPEIRSTSNKFAKLGTGHWVFEEKKTGKIL